MALRDRLSHIWDSFLSQPRHDLVLRITLFLLLVHGTSSLVALIPLRILCGLMLISRKLHKQPGHVDSDLRRIGFRERPELVLD